MFKQLPIYARVIYHFGRNICFESFFDDIFNTTYQLIVDKKLIYLGHKQKYKIKLKLVIIFDNLVSSFVKSFIRSHIN